MSKTTVLWSMLFVVLFSWCLDARAQQPFQVTHETSNLNDMTFAWSPDGTQLAYIAYSGNKVNLYRINLDGTNKKLLADSVNLDYGCPVDWKGSYIAFKAQAATGNYPYNMLLRRIKPDGTGEKTLFGPYWYGDYVLRPGGGWLLFREAPGGWWVARRIDMNGGNVLTVSHSALVQGIGWLGKSHILYTRGDNYYLPCKLYKVDFNGANLKELTPNPLTANIQFSASPDSSKILYCDAVTDKWEIWIMNADGSNKKQLTSDAAHKYLSWPLQNIWSTDCQSFYFVSQKSGKGNIFKLNIDGTGLTQITFGDSINYMPNLSPDGKKLAFLSRRDGYTNIWYLDLEKIQVSLPDTTEAPGKFIDIPVYVSDLSNKKVFSFGMTVETDPNILTPQKVITTGTLTQSWGDATFNISGGKIKVAIAGSAPLSGSGKLIYLRYLVPAGAAHNNSTPITITDFVFNDGQPEVALHHGKFTVIARYDISGVIKYFSNNIPIPAVEVKLDGLQKITGNTGEFTFLDVIYGNYTLRPHKTGASAHAVGPYDAALILLYSVQLQSLTPYQKIAGDVSGNGNVTTMDASYVLQYYVGLIPKFPVGKDWKFVPTSFAINHNNWPTAPDSIRYAPLNADKTNQDFVGIVYGDVSGNWQAPPGPLDLLLAQASAQSKLSLGIPQQQSGGRWILPLEMTAESELISVGIVGQYNPNQLKFVAAELNATSISPPLFLYHEQNGTIRLAMASAHPIANRRATINLIFASVDQNQQPQPGFFAITEFSVNGKSYQAQTTGVDHPLESALPERFELCQNYPNPFNAETLVKYQLPRAEHVTIQIYNLLGQKIRTLVAEPKEAGFHQVAWNGLNDGDEAVGSGEYLCQMRVGDFVAVKKIILIR